MEDFKKSSSDYRYLERLQFDPALRKSWLNFFVSNFRVVMLLIVFISAWGIFSFFQLPLESNPEVKIPFAVVVTSYPGASPSDVEELVSKKVETAAAGLKGIKRIISNSSNSLSLVTVEFEAGENLDDSIRKLKDKIDLVRDLPEEAGDPLVQEISLDDTPILTFSLTGPVDGFILRDYAETIKDELEKNPGVREIKIFGGDEREFSISYDPEKLIFYGVSADEANQAIRAENLAVPAGIFKGETFTYPVRSDSRFFDAQSLAQIPVKHADNGSVIFLKDLANVKEASIEKTILSRMSVDGGLSNDAVTIDVVKRTGGSVVDTVEGVRASLDEIVKTLPEGVRYEVTTDLAKFIRDDFSQLSKDLLITLLLVMGTLFLLVGLKEAFVAGLAIPLVFFITFGVMHLTDTTLNFLSIFSLILALGLLVDDAIVVVSATKQYLRTGKFTPEEAVLLVLRDFKVVLTTTTLTTVWAFLPLLLSTGIMGEFIKSIPVTVSVTLIASLLVALMINHPLAAVLERIRLTRRLFFIYITGLFMAAFLCFISGVAFLYALGAVAVAGMFFMLRWYGLGGRQRLIENRQKMESEWKNNDLIKQKLLAYTEFQNESWTQKAFHGLIHLDKVLPAYEKYLRIVIATNKSRKTVFAAVTFVFLGSVLLPVTGIVPTEFFPDSDFELVYVGIKAPIGTKLEKTDEITRRVEERLLKYTKEVDNFSTVVGQSNSEQGRSLVGSGDTASVVINLKDKKERGIVSYDFAEVVRKDLSDIKEAEITVSAPKGGPPAGAAFEARISGDDLRVLEQVGNDLKKILTSIPGVVDANISLRTAPAEYTFKLDPVLLERNNLNAAYVGSVLRMAISGAEVTTVIRNNKDIDVVARFNKEKIPTLEAVQNLQILNFRKQPVFLKDVAKVELTPALETITRIDQKRVVQLTAGAEGNTRPNEVLAQFQKKLAAEYTFPDGYAIEYGGENEQNQESVTSILYAMIIAMVLIVSTLVIQFNSFKKAFIVLMTIPLALIGVFIGLGIFGISLSFPGLIGVLALFGIVVKNAIILVDKINLNLKSGIAFEESIVDAGKSRLEAIFITSICTIFGIIPITLSNEMWLALGGAVIFGLALSSFLTLFITPALFAAFIKREERV